jgi:hypothetical protein
MTAVWLLALAGLPSFIEYPPDADGPKAITVSVGFSGTERAYCARPGVDTCREWDELPDPRPPDFVFDMKTNAPYPGLDVMAEVFPLAPYFTNALQGLGVVGSFGYGTLTNSFRGTERHGSAALAFRFFFQLGDGPKAYVGVRLGVRGSVFEVPPFGFDMDRFFPFAGAELALRIFVWLRVEGTAEAFYNPVMRNISLFGQRSSANGFAAGGGLAGSIWGPFGWRVHVRYEQINDRFSGGGATWTSTTKGAATETLLRFTGALVVSI